ncbi:hypothetical protein BH09PSE4_BH09PSE4_12390 [soil metagenome]
MILALLIAAATPQSAVDAEIAFNHAAQIDGQWTAFRRFAAPGAIMFEPQPTLVTKALKGRQDPPVSVAWAPASSFVSCDGRTAVNSGPWSRANGSVGYFTTIWARGTSGWKWRVDSGDRLTTPRPTPVVPDVQKAECAGRATPVAAVRYRDGQTGEGMSRDRTLSWRWHVAPDGARTLSAWLWDGKVMQPVVADVIAARP